MSKSATEQFQIKKKRKHPLSGASVAVAAPQTLAHTPLYVVDSASEAIIKQNFSEFQIDDKHLQHSIHFKPITTAEDTADIFIDSECIAAAAVVGSPAPIAAITASSGNCLRDKTHVPSTLLRKSPTVAGSNNIMPLQHGFYVKGALGASKRALKSLKNQHNSSAPLSTGPALEAKRPRRSLSRALAEENAKLHSQAPLVGQTASNLNLSYLLGESLSRHGRLQEGFDIYALIASEQPEGFIPLEKLNILATALLEHIRILSSNSKKSNDTTDSHVDSHAMPLTAMVDDPQHKLNKVSSLVAPASSSSCLASQWQLAAGSLTSASYIAVKPLISEASPLDLHNPSRELARAKSPSPSEDYDPLLCPLCRDILRCPVTANCGHTFCRQCCETITMCNICHLKFPRWQKDDSTLEGNNRKSDGLLQLATLSTATSTTTSSSSSRSVTGGSLTPTVQHFTTHQQQLFTFPPNASEVSSVSTLRIVHSPTQTLMATSPTTVTTTTIACTTDTATTTMAATSSATLNSGGRGGSSSSDNMKFMPDVLVRRLVEKWWGPDLQAKKILETATSYMHSNLLDDALKFCNLSLEKSPSNFKSLLLRAEVLRKMNHYQSSLADVDNALKSRYTSAKAHYLRSLALSDLSRYEEALYEICLAISLDKSTNLSSTELFQHDLTKILQKLLSQTPKCIKLDMVGGALRSKCPYGVGGGLYAEHRLRRRNIAIQEDDEAVVQGYEDDDFLSANYGKDCDILADEDVLMCTDFLNCADKRTTYARFAKKYEMELKRQTSRKHFRRKWMQKETELLPAIDVESARCSGQFRNVLERLQQEIVRLKKIESSPEYALKQLIAVSPSLIDASDFDCVLCCRTFWKPVVTPCGHTYCLVCLDRCMDYTSSCPLCMAPLVEPSVNMLQGASSPVPLVLTKRPVTKFLEAAMKRFIPDSYHKRFRQEMVLEPSVPIFICTTAFPYVPCPLFVYEPRYRLMVRRAVESGDKQFGIVQPQSGKTRYYDYGCILDIRDCVLLGDGCSILSTVGCKRFKILARNEKDGYETAKVEYIHDEAIPEEHLPYVTSMHAIVLEKAIGWYESLGEDLKHEILQSYGEMPLVEENWEKRDDGPAWAWWIIALLPLRPQLKVDILATTSLEKRLRAIEKTIHSVSGNNHYQRVSQNCNVAVVVHNQQHHHLDSPHHHHHHLHRHDDDVDVDVEEEDEDDMDMDIHTDNVVIDEDDDEDVVQTTLEHHIQNLEDEDDVDMDVPEEHLQQQQQQQLSPQQHHRPHHRRHLRHHQLLHNPLHDQQEHCENVENVDVVDACCQRTTSGQNNASNGQTPRHEQANGEQHHHHQHRQHHHHHYDNHRHAGHAHSLLL